MVLSISFVVADEFGNCLKPQCSGLKGLVQHGDADASLFYISLDNLDPIIDNRLSISKISSDNYISLTSIVGDLKSRNMDIIETLTIIDVEVLILYILVGWFLFWWFSNISDSNLWLTWRHIIGQCHEPNQSSGRLKTASVCFLMSLFWFHCMFGNLISTDLVAAPPPVLIKKLSDIFEFNRKPSFGTNSGLKFSISRNKIWRKLWNNRHRLVKTKADLRLALSDMAMDGDVLLTMKYQLTMVERMYCMQKLNKNMFYKGNRKIGRVNEAHILNVNISSHIRTAIDRAHVAYDMYGMREKMALRDFAETILGTSAEVDQCLASNGYRLNQMVSVKPLDFYNVRYLTCSLLFALVLGTVLIGHEFLTRYRIEVRKSFRKSSRAVRKLLKNIFK